MENRKNGRNEFKKWLFPSAERTDVTEKVPRVGVAAPSARGAAVAVTLSVRGADVVCARSRRDVVVVVIASANVAAVVVVVALLVLWCHFVQTAVLFYTKSVMLPFETHQ